MFFEILVSSLVSCDEMLSLWILDLFVCAVVVEGGTQPAGDTVHRQTETGQVCFLLQTVPGDFKGTV